jgi:hypothetical protein
MWLLMVFVCIFAITSFFFVREYYKLQETRNNINLLSERIQTFDSIVHSDNWRKEYLHVMSEGSLVKEDLVQRFSYTPSDPEDFLADRFIRYWFYNLSGQDVELDEDTFTYEAMLPGNAKPEDWSGELNDIFLLTETFPPGKIFNITFREQFDANIWMRFCKLELKVNYIALMGLLQKSKLFIWEYTFDKVDEGFYHLEITYCVRMQEVDP